MKLYYCLETIDAIIVSQSSASAAMHKTLDFIPGNAILGAIAAQCYAKLDENDSWNIFHAGSVKFSNAYITSLEDEKLIPSYPVPLSWHVAKGESIYKDEILNEEIYNHAHKDTVVMDGKQMKQCRSGYINTGKHECGVKLSSSTKTAIDFNTETIDKSKLFSYNHIQPNQRFIGFVEAEAKFIDEIKAALQNIKRIGRSRSTEFGRVRVSLLEPPIHEITIDQVNKGQFITIWLSSDCQILDNHCFPVLTPSGSDIGLKDAELVLSRSFINTHSTILYNRKRLGFDSEQTVINKGSVLVYEAKKDISVEQLSFLQQKGLGINKQQGLGEIIINPPWSQNSELEPINLVSPMHFNAEKLVQVKTDFKQPNPSALINWIANKSSSMVSQQANEKNINKALKSIIGFYHQGREYNQVKNCDLAGPSKSQWGRLYNFIRDSNDVIKEGNIELGRIIEIKSTDVYSWDLGWDNGKKTFSTQFKFKLLNLTSLELQRQLLERLKQYPLDTIEGLSQLEETV